MNEQLLNGETLKDEYDFITQIAEKCNEKGYSIENFEFYIDEEECEICKIQNYILRVALIDNEILKEVFNFERKFWNTTLECESTFKELVEMQLNITNSYLVSLN